MLEGKTFCTRDFHCSDAVVAVFVVVPRFVRSLVSSLSGALGREVNFLLSPLRLWLPSWSLIPSQVLTSALGSVRNSRGCFFLPTTSGGWSSKVSQHQSDKAALVSFNAPSVGPPSCPTIFLLHTSSIGYSPETILRNTTGSSGVDHHWGVSFLMPQGRYPKPHGGGMAFPSFAR